MLKKILAVMLTTATVIATPYVAIAKTTHKTLYRKEFAICYDISVKDNIAYLTTGDGNVWMIECDDADIGDIYHITFNTHNTKSVKDDSIIAIKYINMIDNVNNVVNEESELQGEYENAVFTTTTRVENYMNSITDSVYSVAYNTPSDLDEHAKKMTSQLYIMYKFGLIAKDDYVMTTGQIEALVKDIQSDYNGWRESHKIYEI